MSTSDEKQVGYVYSEEYVDLCCKMPRLEDRARLVHHLIQAYNLVDKMKVARPKPASIEEICAFHSSDFVNTLQACHNFDMEDEITSEMTEYGLGYDCPLFPDVFSYASFVTGGTITAARLLTSRCCSIAINWFGGWHHAKRDMASGFCYCNDVVLGVLHLKTVFDKILYIDLDLHHGDGVEDAFLMTDKVFTLSFHKYAPGFFPGTGSISTIGKGKGQYYTLNIPLKDGITDQKYTDLFHEVFTNVMQAFQPNAVVCQFGADGLVEDPMRSFNLTSLSLGKCLSDILSYNLPTLCLGGGGYNFTNTAKCWCYLTSIILEQKLDTQIPEHQFFDRYGPDFELFLSPSNRSDTNESSYVKEIREKTLG
ncbi:uncharacterized protein TRIADDRAFT_25928 [Trichoplax adhaerens]|uniref:Histone deacetylase 8 n=1 Tax=Trichoplax adhaerens TaxID=10228 RepID=B3RYK4_TRIAD|nr:hypothetical protein TRIADDRAFT_25928 [Trichoplax adhaerens]EDV25056.1 hypothetical protein TRIADDRAFT_25928 [Trichoplax adhaerens]|eukprot:XP_002112946.1 hypothetical protein TRIADDRAFT_25928 [Trichoplax adhaerens]